jgi:hypothetical protein
MKVRIACLAALACMVAAQAAPPVTREEMLAQKVRIEQQYDQSHGRCQRVEGHGRELCNQQARGERAIQLAELEMQAHPTVANERKLRLVRAEADYALAMIRCKGILGAARRVCREDAGEVLDKAKAELKLPTEAAAAGLRPERDRSQAERIAAAQFDAARERCDRLPGEARAACLADAKQRFGRL